MSMLMERLSIVKEKNIDVVKIFDLRFYDHDMAVLYRDLKKFLEEKFCGQPASFLPNERIVFFHQDLDFFISRDFPGFTLYNLQLILRELDISNNFCIVVSNLLDYSHYTQLAQQLLTTDEYPITGISTQYFGVCSCPVYENSLEIDQIDRGATILSRLSRFHRTYFMSQLFARNLQDKNYVSYHNISGASDVLVPAMNAENQNCPCHFLYSVPFNRNNPEILIYNEQRRNQVRQFQSTVSTFKNFTESTNINDKNLVSVASNIDILKKSLVYVGLESSVNCPSVFQSNISFKGIATKRPFIILGAPRIIKQMQQFGFKTFDHYWSEQYDAYENLEDRVDAILDIVEMLSTKSTSELQAMARSMQDIIEYNFNHLVDTFPRQQAQEVINSI